MLYQSNSSFLILFLNNLNLKSSFFILVLPFLVGCGSIEVQKQPSVTNLPEGILIPAATRDTGEIRYAVFPAPPFMIGAEDENLELSGIDVEIVQELGRRMDLDVRHVRCTWARCLELIKNGDVDLLSSAYKKPDREEFMVYFQQPFLEQLPIAFYFLAEKDYSVDVYEDIYQFENIGVLMGASYFDQFDTDARANKFEVTSQEQLFPMLLAGRLDAVAGYVPTENYHLVTQGYRDLIKRSAYEYQETSLVYMAVSKKSPLVGRLDEFNRVNLQLISEGFISNTIKRYYERYR